MSDFFESNKPPRPDDTLATLMRDSADKLKQVSSIIERGRITKNQRIVKPAGPWCMGLLYYTEAFEIRLCVATTTAQEDPPPTFKYFGKAVYLGLKGKANIYVGSGYMRLIPSVVSHIEMGQEHVVEPLENNTQILLILIGEGREENNEECSASKRGSGLP